MNTLVSNLSTTHLFQVTDRVTEDLPEGAYVCRDTFQTPIQDLAIPARHTFRVKKVKGSNQKVITYNNGVYTMDIFAGMHLAQKPRFIGDESTILSANQLRKGKTYVMTNAPSLTSSSVNQIGDVYYKYWDVNYLVNLSRPAPRLELRSDMLFAPINVCVTTMNSSTPETTSNEETQDENDL